MSPRPSVSIVVPSRTGHIEALRAQLARQSLQGWELVVVKGISPPARARNRGASQARGEVLVFLDDDIELGDDRLLEELIHALEAVGPASGVGVLWRVSPHASWFQRLQQCDVFDTPVPAADTSWAPVPWDALGTACCAIRRATFEQLQGFDQTLCSAEDFDLWYRLERAGGATYVLRDRWVYHDPPRTVPALIRKAIWYERGNAQLARKYPTSGYRMTLRSRWHAAGYLAMRTALLPPLVFIKVSYRHRRPALAFRPLAAMLSYVGAWAYCLEWFRREDVAGLSRPVIPAAELTRS